MILVLLAVVLGLVLWTVAVGRVVERRVERRFVAMRSDVELLRDAQLGLAHAFVERWDGLDKAVSEGLSIAAKEAETKPAADPFSQASFVRNSVALLSQADAVILQTADGRGYALPMKVGRC